MKNKCETCEKIGKYWDEIDRHMEVMKSSGTTDREKGTADRMIDHFMAKINEIERHDCPFSIYGELML